MATSRVTADAARRNTGRDWDGWAAALDEWGAADQPHGAIVDWLTGQHGLDNWWAQTVTVEYERARGLRAPGSGRDGRFTVTASRTAAATATELAAAFTDPARRTRWLPDGQLRLRTQQPGRTARFDWADGRTRVNVGFTDRGPGRATVALAHERLADQAEADHFRDYWRDRLDALVARLAGAGSEQEAQS